MIVDNIKDFINLYLNEYAGSNISNLEFCDPRLYGELLDYCFSEALESNFVNMVKDIYKYHLEKKNKEVAGAYNYYILEYSSKKNCKTKIGELYLYGSVVPKDYKKALHWFLLDEERRSPNTLYYLGYMYYKGLGMEVDYQKAFEYFSASGKAKYTSAYLWLGSCYLHGHGVEQNYNFAYKYFQLGNYSFSADKDEICYYLGLCLENGYGVEKDFIKAIEFYYESAGKKYAKAIERLKELGFGINNSFNINKYEDGEYKILNEIISDGEVVLLPEVTHIGFEFTLIREARVEGDYHHFKTTYIPAEYEIVPISITISENIKKIIIKNDVKISEMALQKLENIIVEIKK